MFEIKNFIKENLLRKDGKLNNWYKKYLTNDMENLIIINTSKCVGSFVERIYWILNDLNDYPQCLICNKKVTKFLSNKNEYKKFCSNKCSYIFIGNNVSEKLSNKSNNEWKEIVSKRKQTKLEKYGNENYVNTEKEKQTKLERYGNENYNNRELSMKTCYKNNGYNTWFESKEGKSWIINNNKTRNYSMSSQTHEKWLKKCKNKKEYIFPSGKKVLVQGYESIVIDILLKEYQESEIIIEHNLKPKIKYIFDDKNRNYFPDIWIPKDNLIIEVKSTYTMKLHYLKNIAKSNKCKEMGLNFKFYILDGKNNLTIL